MVYVKQRCGNVKHTLKQNLPVLINDLAISTTIHVFRSRVYETRPLAVTGRVDLYGKCHLRRAISWVMPCMRCRGQQGFEMRESTGFVSLRDCEETTPLAFCSSRSCGVAVFQACLEHLQIAPVASFFFYFCPDRAFTASDA